MKVREIKKGFLKSESNRINHENFEKLLPHFYYDSEHEKRVMEAINSRQKIDDYLELDSEKRRFFEIEGIDQLDRSFEKYCDMLNREALVSFGIDERDIPALFDYKVYSTGRLLDGQKLFKFLKKKKVFSDDDIKYLTGKKVGKFFACISRNPVDFLFCSTNQSFGSCLNLESEYPYYIGLPSSLLDPNRYMIYIFSGKFKQHTVKGLEFKHFRYISRSWCIAGVGANGIIGTDLQTYVVRAYPNNSISFQSILEGIGIGNRWSEGLESFEPARIEGEVAFPYLDNLGLDGYGKNWFYSERGATGVLNDFEYSGGFENLESVEALMESGYRCVDCGDGVTKMMFFIHLMVNICVNIVFTTIIFIVITATMHTIKRILTDTEFIHIVNTVSMISFFIAKGVGR